MPSGFNFNTMNIKELKEIIKDLPDDTPIRSEGADYGGYDVCIGYKVIAEIQYSHDNKRNVLHICHDGS